jgi:hypothetical protein
MPTTFKPPLTAEKLREIGLRRDAADILALLWEIKRLRAHVLRADQIVGQIRNGDYLVETFRKELQGEPCLEEAARLRASADVTDMPPKVRRREN